MRKRGKKILVRLGLVTMGPLARREENPLFIVPVVEDGKEIAVNCVE